MKLYSPVGILSTNTPMPGDWLLPNGQIKLMTLDEIDKVPFESRRMWCHHHTRYSLITVELIDWLDNFLGKRTAIEIGSGSGDLAYHLKIPGTDNKCQTWPDVRNYYVGNNQPPIIYPDWVEEIDAVNAVWKHKPQVVIGSWITNWIDPKKKVPVGGGSIYGIKEDRIIKSGVTYVMIGNREIHKHKPILKLPHKEIQLPFLRSRSANDENNVIYIWEGRR